MKKIYLFGKHRSKNTLIIGINNVASPVEKKSFTATLSTIGNIQSMNVSNYYNLNGTFNACSDHE